MSLAALSFGAMKALTAARGAGTCTGVQPQCVWKHCRVSCILAQRLDEPTPLRDEGLHQRAFVGYYDKRPRGAVGCNIMGWGG